MTRGPILLAVPRGFENQDDAPMHPDRSRTHADTTRLTRVYRLIYQDQLQPSATPTNGVSFLRRIEVEGVDGDIRELLPPLEFAYTGFDASGRIYQPMSAIGDAVPELISTPRF
jgi:hypothetical protein